MKDELIKDYIKLILYYEKLLKIEKNNKESLINNGVNAFNLDITIAISKAEIIKLNELRGLCVRVVADLKTL